MRAKLFQHSLELGLDAFCGLATPRTGICEEIGHDGTAGVEAVILGDGVKAEHSLKVGGGISGNILPVLADFAGNFVERSHIYHFLVTLYYIAKCVPNRSCV